MQELAPGAVVPAIPAELGNSELSRWGRAFGSLFLFPFWEA